MLTWALVATFAIEGCGGGEPIAGDGGVEPDDGAPAVDAPACEPASSEVDVETLLGEWAAATCEGLERCPTGRSWASTDACIAGALHVSARSGVSVVPWAAARALAREGRLRIDPAAAEDCIARARADCPSEILWDEQSCSDALVPTCPSPGGTACRSDLECGRGQRCIGYPTEVPFLFCGTEGAGHCSEVPDRDLGEACDEEARCRGAESLCFMGSCRGLVRETDPAAEGEPCRTLTLRPDGSAAYATCASGLACMPSSPDASTCRRVATTGEPCEDTVCAHGLLCVGGACEPQFTIEPGAACPPYSLDCGAGFLCTVDGCREAATGGVGSICDPTSARCDAGLACVESTCVAELRETGESCWTNGDCVSGCCAGSITDLRCR